MAGRLPDFLIIGAKKSGTSSLRHLLDGHPSLRCLGEVHFFCGEYGAHDLDWYRGRFSDAPTDALVGEKCPCYMTQPDALARMRAAVPEAKLIAILRDPVHRTYADYWHERGRGNEALGFREALEGERARNESGLDGFGYFGGSRYLPQLERVCRVFPREQLCVMILEELVERPSECLAPVLDFLGVSRVEGDVELPAANPSRELRAQWLLRLMYGHRLWRFLPPRAARALHDAMVRERAYPPIDPGIERELRAEFEPDNRRLAEWLGRDLEPWGVRRPGRFRHPEARPGAPERPAASKPGSR